MLIPCLRKVNLFFRKNASGASTVADYYFDTETTGFNPDVDEIITIQWQRLNELTGEPMGELNILKRWESSEKEIMGIFAPNLRSKPFDFVFVGKNLMFDFCLLNQRMKQYDLGEIDLRYLYDRALVDLKPVLVMINNGRFRGYGDVLPRTNPVRNEDIPQLYREGRYSEIVRYIKDEAEDFTNAYQILKREMPRLKNLITKP